MIRTPDKTALFVALTAAVLLSPITSIGTAVQESQEEPEVVELREKASRLDPTSKEFFDLIKRDELSDAEVRQARNIMRSDDRLRQMIDGGPLEITSISFVGNANTLPVKWYPVIHTTDGAEITSVKLDLDANEIKSVDTYKRYRLDQSNAYAVDEYSGTPDLVKGIAVTSESQPTNYDGSEAYSGFSALVLDAKMYGSIRDKLCSPAYFPSTYWLQVGALFNEKGWLYVYADTTTRCVVKKLKLPEPDMTDDVNYKIYGGSTWYIVLHNEDKNDFAYHQQSGLNSGWIEMGDDSTSVFFENGYEGSGWDSQFIDGNPSRTNAQVMNSDNSWVDWSGNEQYILDSNGNVRANNVISGTLRSGGTATWDVSQMSNWPKC